MFDQKASTLKRIQADASLCEAVGSTRSMWRFRLPAKSSVLFPKRDTPRFQLRAAERANSLLSLLASLALFLVYDPNAFACSGRPIGWYLKPSEKTGVCVRTGTAP